MPEENRAETIGHRVREFSWENEELCCGFGGTFAVKMPDVSTAMADEKIEALVKSGADTLVSGDSSCLMHLSGRLKRKGHDTRVLHLAQVLDSGDRKAV
jgi:L-lactate dehydrogenase complex protein LldE